MNSTDPSALLSSASEEAAEAAILEQFAAARTAANASQLVQFSLGGVVSAADSSTDSLVSASAQHAGANTSIIRVEEGLGGPVVSGAGPSSFSGPSSQLMPQGADDNFSTEFSSVSSSVSITRFQSYIAYLRQPSGAGGVVRVQVVDQAEDVVLVLYDDSAHMEWISPTALLVPPPRQPNRAAPVPRVLSRPTTPRGTPSKLGVSNTGDRPLTPIQTRMGVAAAASPRGPSVTLVPSPGPTSPLAAGVSPPGTGISSIVWPTQSTPLELQSPAPPFSTSSSAVRLHAPPSRLPVVPARGGRGRGGSHACRGGRGAGVRSAGYSSAGNSEDDSRPIVIGSFAPIGAVGPSEWEVLPNLRDAFFETQKSKSVLYASPAGMYRAVDLVAFLRREVAAPEYRDGRGHEYRADIRTADGRILRADLHRIFRFRHAYVGKSHQGEAAIFPSPPCVAQEIPGLLLEAQFRACVFPDDGNEREDQEVEAAGAGPASHEPGQAPRRKRVRRRRGRGSSSAGGSSDGGSVRGGVADLRTDISEPSTSSGRHSRGQESITGDSRPASSRLPKVDPKLIKTYVGQNEEGRIEEYQLRPRTWVKEAWSKLVAQDVPEQHRVRLGLQFCSLEIRNRYENDRMKPYGASGDWLPWVTPATPSSLVWANFARWLCEVYGKYDTGWWDQVLIFSQMRQGPKQTVREFVTEFERQRHLLHDLRTLYDDVYEHDSGSNPVIWPPPIRESRWDRDLFCAALRPAIGDTLLTLSVQTASMKSYSEDALATYAPDILSRRRQSGYFELRLGELQEIAETIEAALAKTARARGEQSRIVRKPFQEREPREPWAPHPPPPPRRPLRRLLNSHSVEELDDEEPLPEVEHLYQRLQQEHKVRWTRGQLKVLFDKGLCFKCAKHGHKSPECPNAAVNPSTFRFTNLVEMDAYEEDDDLYQALYAAYVAGNGEASLV